jgi:hypothetical protein
VYEALSYETAETAISTAEGVAAIMPKRLPKRKRDAEYAKRSREKRATHHTRTYI